MTFSIALPVHNGEKFLEAAIASVLHQRRPADEIVALDDASSDRSAEIIKSEKWGGKVRYAYNETPTGFADAWNRIVTHTHSDYVAILHQDDLLDPEYLERVEQALAAYPRCQHVFSGYRYIDVDGNVRGESPLPHAETPELIPGKEYAHRYLAGMVQNRHIHRCPGVTTARSLLIARCRYRKEAGLITDDDFFLRVGEFTDVIGISLPLASYRIHNTSVTETLKSLSARLAADYIFQTEQCRLHEPFLSEPDRQLIHGLAVRFINTYLMQSMIKNEWHSVAEAARLRSQFESLAPGVFGSNSSMNARTAWMLARVARRNAAAANVLSTVMRTALRLKKAMR